MSIELMMPSNHLILWHSFSSCPQSFSASGSFPVSCLFTSGGQRIGASALRSVLPMNIQCWFSLGLISLISLLSKRLSVLFQHVWVLGRFSHVWLSVTLLTAALQAPLSMGILRARTLEWVARPSFRGSSQPRDPTYISYVSCIDRQFFTTSVQHHNSKASVLQGLTFFMLYLSHLYRTTRKTIALTIWTFVGKVMSLPFNMLSRFVIAFHPRSKCLFISWLQSHSEVIWSPRQ